MMTPTTLTDAVREQVGASDDAELAVILRDVRKLRAMADVPGFTYYAAVAFAEKHKDAIYDALYQDSQKMGAANVLAHLSSFAGANYCTDHDALYHLLAQWALEHVAAAQEGTAQEGAA